MRREDKCFYLDLDIIAALAKMRQLSIFQNNTLCIVKKGN